MGSPEGIGVAGEVGLCASCLPEDGVVVVLTARVRVLVVSWFLLVPSVASATAIDDAYTSIISDAWTYATDLLGRFGVPLAFSIGIVLLMVLVTWAVSLLQGGGS